MNTKKLLALAFALIFVAGMIAGCQTATPAATPEPSKQADTPATTEATAEPAASALPVITVSVDVLEAEKCGNNPKSDFIAQKFGIKFDYVPVDWGTWNEKIKTWVSAGDPPDLVWWDLKGASSQDYKTWASQGAFKEIPMDKINAQPELKKIADGSGSIAVMKVDGKLYAWPSNRHNPDAAQNTYMSHWAYRRDWAKAVGLYKEGDVYSYDEWVALCKAVIEKDPGKNGPGNTAGMVMQPWAFPHAAVLFIGPVLAEGNETCSYIKGADGKYVWPPSLPEYKDGVLKTYDLLKQGIIWKDNIQFKGSEAMDLVNAGRAFACYDNNSAWIYNDTVAKLLKGGLATDKDAYGPAIITFDGNFYMTQTEDYWTVTAFSNKVDDAKMDRVLSLWNWLNSQEGILFQYMGFEGKDFTKNSDGTFKILWAPDPAVPGGWINPYSEIRTNEFTMAGLLPPGNPSDLPYGLSQDQQVWDYMASHPTKIKPFDYGVSFFSAPNKDKFGTFGMDVKSKLIELLQSSSDIGADWDAFVQSMMPKVQPILDEINAGVK